MVMFLPREILILSFTCFGVKPMAVKTWETANALLEQAEPAETATPARSKATISVSLLNPANLMFKIFGRQLFWEPFNFALPLLCLIISASIWFRKSDTFLKFLALLLNANSTAFAKPTMEATFSVPERNPNSCPAKAENFF